MNNLPVQFTDLPSTLSQWCHEDTPWETGFISIMRAMAAKLPEMPSPGVAELPSQECFRLGQDAHMTFSPREISQLSWEDGKLKIQLFSLGIWGAQGALPLHMTEQAYSRAEFHDNTLTDFLDIFHHRAISHLYRAWFVSQDIATLDRQKDEQFGFYVGSLIGMDPRELGNSSLPIHARLASSAHLIREARNPEGLVGALHYYFDIPVSLEEYTPQWIFLDETEQSILGDDNSSLLLGNGGILGNTVQDRQHKFQLTLGPLTLNQYMRFSLRGQDLPVLREWVRNFVGFEYAWDVKLLLSADEVPLASLSGSHQLGYTTWLERYEMTEPVTGMSFEPELHQN